MEKAALHVGNTVNKEFSENLGELIATVFKSAHENSMEPHVVLKALEVISNVVEVKNVNISSCNFEMKDYNEM